MGKRIIRFIVGLFMIAIGTICIMLMDELNTISVMVHSVTGSLLLLGGIGILFRSIKPNETIQTDGDWYCPDLTNVDFDNDIDV